jgi:hypothetical protein
MLKILTRTDCNINTKCFHCVKTRRTVWNRKEKSPVLDKIGWANFLLTFSDKIEWTIHTESFTINVEKLTFSTGERHVPLRASRWDLSPRHLRFSPCCRTSVGRMRLGTSTSRGTPSLDTLVVDKTLSRKRESSRSRRLVPVSSLCRRRNFYRRTLLELWKRSTSLIPSVRNKRRARVYVCGVVSLCNLLLLLYLLENFQSYMWKSSYLLN